MQYQFDQDGRFVIRDYGKAKPFASFLPGIAGVKGIPLWAYYVNRGQALASFGVEDKDGSIMEFQPAHKSYSLVPTQGFRTFLTYSRGGEQRYVEPFSEVQRNHGERCDMLISDNVLELSSVDENSGLEVQVVYFTLPREEFAALVRKVTIVNRSAEAVQLEALDGLPSVLPFGIDNMPYKELGYTLKSWMDVYNLEQGIPYYKVRGSTADTAEVHQISAGHFMYSFLEREGCSELLKPIVDASVVFGPNSSFAYPERFMDGGLSEILDAEQKTTNKVPGSFCGYEAKLAPGESISHCMVIGHVKQIETINRAILRIGTMAYINGKLAEAKALTRALTDDMDTHTSMPLFDAYCRQNYLDNVLRGGYPELLKRKGQKPFIYHVFSRKHGDLERDYNFFKLMPSFYSQGNGNFRDANQNRRSDVWFQPEVGDFNIRMFMSFIQADGYNPLVVKGCSFVLKDVSALLPLVEESGHEAVKRLFDKPYTPGELLHFLMQQEIPLVDVAADDFLAEALSLSEQQFEADFGEGYWIDHWTYNMDLIDRYLAIYPDRLLELLIGSRDYAYYDSPARVEPRKRKYVLTADGRIRQYGAVAESKDKEKLIRERRFANHWVRSKHGQGEVYASTLLEKLLSLAAIKLATLDPEGLGIEMEANKPGWNDSLNGLPGLFASGFGETCELQRVVQFLRSALKQLPADTVIVLPREMGELIDNLLEALSLNRMGEAEETSDALKERNFRFWNDIAAAREAYREKVFFGFEGTETAFSIVEAAAFLEQAEAKLSDGIQRALQIGGEVFPTYFYYEAETYLVQANARDMGEGDANARVVTVTSFKRKDLPYFLEGPTRAMKIYSGTNGKRGLYGAIRKSGLYDRKLGMYKVNESLAEMPFELGRSRAFTPGWLENESVFMHMEYKYLLECLKGGLYEEFFSDMKKAMPPFMDPAVYGRSTLENSSFIASSANPDEALHGTGYIARLSGSTAEFIEMWTHMMTGGQPFQWDGRTLTLAFMPILPGWLFTKEGELSFTFLGETKVIYRNPLRMDTYRGEIKPLRHNLHYGDGSVKSMEGAVLGQAEAMAVRDKKIIRIEVELG